MDPWGLAPLPGALAFGTVALVAASGRGLPRGRLSLVLVGASGSALLGVLAWILGTGEQPKSLWFCRAADAAFLLALPSWIALVMRFGAPSGAAAKGALLVLLGLVADLGLALIGAYAPEAARIEFHPPQVALFLEGGSSRLATGFFLIAGSLGVFRAQALWEAARRQRIEPLRQAFAGLLLSSLLVFLFAAQTLLYGAASLKVIALGSLLFVPALGALVRVLRSSEPSAATLSAEAEITISSGVLLGLGAFLILLAGIGELVSRVAPVGQALWFQWGGPILVGIYGALWLIPGFRQRLRRSLQVSEQARSYAWDVDPLLEGANPASGGPTLLLLGGLFEQPRGRPAVGLWIRNRQPVYEPWVRSASLLPRLADDNPLPLALHRDRGVLDLTTPPGRLGLVPAYVENLGLIEEQGYRLFLLLQAGDRPFGILGLAPRDRAAGAEAAFLLEHYRGELALLTWGAVVAWCEPPSPACEVLASRYMAARDLLHQLSSSSLRRTISPPFGSRIAAAAEEAARLLENRARRLRSPEAFPLSASAPADVGSGRAAR